MTEEIIVRGRAAPQLRVEIERVEDSIYERFNALNSNDEFDIQCFAEVPTGSRLTVRSCLPQFALRAEAAVARGILRGFQSATADYGTDPMLGTAHMERKGDELLAEMRRVAREDEELLRRLTRLAELKEVLGDRVGKRR